MFSLAKLLHVDQIRGNVKEVTEQTTGQVVGRFQVLSMAFCNVSRLCYISVLCKSEQVHKPKAVMRNQEEVQPNSTGKKYITTFTAQLFLMLKGGTNKLFETETADYF